MSQPAAPAVRRAIFSLSAPAKNPAGFYLLGGPFSGHFCAHFRLAEKDTLRPWLGRVPNAHQWGSEVKSKLRFWPETERLKMFRANLYASLSIKQSTDRPSGGGVNSHRAVRF